MAERGADDLDADLERFRRIDDDLLDGERLAGGSAHRRCMYSSIVRNYTGNIAGHEHHAHPWRTDRNKLRYLCNGWAWGCAPPWRTELEESRDDQVPYIDVYVRQRDARNSFYFIASLAQRKFSPFPAYADGGVWS